MSASVEEAKLAAAKALIVEIDEEILKAKKNALSNLKVALNHLNSARGILARQGLSARDKQRSTNWTEDSKLYKIQFNNDVAEIYYLGKIREEMTRQVANKLFEKLCCKRSVYWLADLRKPTSTLIKRLYLNNFLSDQFMSVMLSYTYRDNVLKLECPDEPDIKIVADIEAELFKSADAWVVEGRLLLAGEAKDCEPKLKTKLMFFPRSVFKVEFSSDEESEDGHLDEESDSFDYDLQERLDALKRSSNSETSGK